MKGFEKLYARLRRRLPKTKGEVKGRNLSEGDVVEVARMLRRIGALFEVVAVDMGMHSKEDLVRHKSGQAEAITAHLTSDHHPNLVEQAWKLRRQLEDMPLRNLSTTLRHRRFLFTDSFLLLWKWRVG